MKKRKLYIIALMCAATLMFGGCGNDNSNVPVVKDVESIAIDSVASAKVEDFNGLQLTCRAYYDDNTSAVATEQVTWSSSNTAVATVSDGLVELASSDGAEVNITASFEHFSDYLTVNVFALSDINASIDYLGTTYEDNITVLDSGPHQLTAMGIFTDTVLDVNNSAIDITTDVAWSVSGDAVATVDAAGLMTMLDTNGTAEVMAKVFDRNDTIDLNVSL